MKIKMARSWSLLCMALLQVVVAEDYSNNVAVQRFQEYVQMNTTTGNDLTPAVEFWQRLAEEEGVSINVYEYVKEYPVVIIKWEGSNSSLDSIMLNSHMDVVPAKENEGWTYPPFSGELVDDVIWGRGTQDMKSVSIQYFQALSQMKANNVTLLRDVYMTLMPDEEVGAEAGMIPFLKSSEFAAMNVGFELDEGSSFNVPAIPLYYQDKVPWQIQIDCYGIGGHSSTFPSTNDTATGKCYNVMGSIFKFRDEEYQKYFAAGLSNAGVYSSVNLNRINGGTANNIIPNHMSLVFDIRLRTTLNEDTFDAQLKQWVVDAGENVTLTYILKNHQSPATLLNASNPYWATFSSVTRNSGVAVLPIVTPGSTDARYVREAGIPALGFSPMPNTDLLLHSVNERLAVSTFLKGIDIYEQLIQALANISEESASADPSVYLYKTAV